MTPESILKSIIWDYDVDINKIYKVLIGESKQESPFTQEKIFIRVLERLSWYSILELLDIDKIKKMLTPEIIKKLRFKEQKERYERIRKILHGEPVSFTGWDPANREKYRNSVLSNRWYRT